jgi:hypothetical protein
VRVFKRLGTACLVVMLMTAFVSANAFAQAPAGTAPEEQPTGVPAAGPAEGGTTATGAGPAGGGGAVGLSTPTLAIIALVGLAGLVALAGGGMGGGGSSGPSTTPVHP